MTPEEIKNLKNGDYIEVEIDGYIYMGPFKHLSKPEKYSGMFYTEFCSNKSEWDLETIGVKSFEIKRHLPKLMSLDDQIKKYYPQYLI